MRKLRRNTWALRLTLMAAYLVFVSFGVGIGCMRSYADAHIEPGSHHSNCPGMPTEQSSKQEHHQHSNPEKPFKNTYCIHCACWLCAITAIDRGVVLNSPSSDGLYGPAAASWFVSVSSVPEIPRKSLSPPGSAPYNPTPAGLRSVVLLI